MCGIGGAVAGDGSGSIFDGGKREQVEMVLLKEISFLSSQLWNSRQSALELETVSQHGTVIT